MKKLLASIWEVAEVVLIALVTVFVIRSFIVQPFLVSGASMSPTFADGNYLLIDELTYDFRKPERGEVVVFRYPGDKSSFFIKRIIGLPGEKVVIENNTVTIHPKEESTEKAFVLPESYLLPQTKTIGEVSVKLGEDEYFVLGDNRTNSFDSRNWGALLEKNIIGVVRLRLYPFSQFETVGRPAYTP